MTLETLPSPRPASSWPSVCLGLAGLAIVALAPAAKLAALGVGIAVAAQLWAAHAARVPGARSLTWHAAAAVALVILGLAALGSPVPPGLASVQAVVSFRETPLPSIDAPTAATSLALRTAGIACVLAGLGALAGWAPFTWAAPDLESESSATAYRARLMAAAAALLLACRMTAGGAFELERGPAIAILTMAAVLTLAVHISRYCLRGDVRSITGFASALAAAALAADLAPATLTVARPSGAAAAWWVWLHAVACLVVWEAVRTGRTPSRELVEPAVGHAFRRDAQARGDWLRRVLKAELAGLPPGPGFWLRGALLLSLVSRSASSNLSGEFEPAQGLYLLAFGATAAWGAVMARTFRDSDADVETIEAAQEPDLPPGMRDWVSVVRQWRSR
ncbi:MAG: hypothetical protein KF774_01955 [Planctomyces sp.]|nr:hypothetical protein [Planctomyces sp.]